jgi:uroporphyrinogen-III synthase
MSLLSGFIWSHRGDSQLQQLPRVRVSIAVPEPNTWRDLLAVLDQNKATSPVAGRRIAIQEYGVTNPQLSAGLQERGAIVSSVNVYQWALPEDLSLLEKVVDSIISGVVHALLVASSVQIRHLFEIAEGMGKREALRDALSRVVITSVGPLTSEELRSYGLSVDIECTRPKMGFLVQEAAEKALRFFAKNGDRTPRERMRIQQSMGNITSF